MADGRSPRARDHRDGVRQTLPLGVAVFGFGISFGVLARASGMGTLAPVVMSVTTFAGSAQFAAISVLGAGGGVAAAVAAAVLLNARYAPIGVSVAPYLTGPWWSRFLHGQLIVDESWAIAAEGDGRFNTKVLVGAGLTIYVAWVVGTVVGVAFGDLIGDPDRLGLDAAFPALFLALLVPQLNSRTARQAALLGAVIALALTPFTPAGVPIVAASVACLLGLRAASSDPDPSEPQGNA
jgi:4-azaleucine resistance transporter AzlC